MTRTFEKLNRILEGNDLQVLFLIKHKIYFGIFLWISQARKSIVAVLRNQYCGQNLFVKYYTGTFKKDLTLI